MTTPVKELNPLRKISWTLWNLDEDGQIASWLATRNDLSVKQLLEEIDGEWVTVSGNNPALDRVWHGFTIHGIGWKMDAASGSNKPFMLYVPNVRHAFVETEGIDTQP